jgi:hypothetical protein
MASNPGTGKRRIPKLRWNLIPFRSYVGNVISIEAESPFLQTCVDAAADNQVVQDLYI